MVEFIDAHRGEFGVEPICRALQFAPSTYYDAKSRPESQRARRHRAMGAVLVSIWAAQLAGLRGPQALGGGPAGQP